LLRDLNFVMAGLDPAIHAVAAVWRKAVDARVKPGHDAVW
jgi:hypothetical protein